MSIDQVVRQERRMFERCIPETANVLYSTGFLSFLGYKMHEAPVVDLSEGGLCMSVPERLNLNKKMRLVLMIPRYDEKILLKGVVRRCFENRKDSRIYAGIEFVDVQPAVRAKLKAMCEYFNSSYYRERCREREEKKLFY